VKRTLLALSLIAIAPLSAYSDTEIEPCCFDIRCDWTFSVEAEFLYWSVRETNLPFAAVVDIVSRNSTVPDVPDLALIQDLKFLKTKWDPGFRVGFDWNIGCDGWDIFSTWTYFFNKSSSSIHRSFPGLQPALGESGVVNPWINFTAQGMFPIQPALPIFEDVSAKWRLYFNQIDLALGKKYWLNDCFAIKPYAGLRGVWNRTHFNTEGSQGPKDTSNPTLAISDFFNEASTRWNAKQWAICLLVGVEPDWYFTNNFSLFANFDLAMGWGNFHQRFHEKYIISGNGGPGGPPGTEGPFVIIDEKNSYKERFSTMATLLDLALGLRWEQTWGCDDRYLTALDLGWEQHIWFDVANRVMTFGTDTETSTGGEQTQTFTGFIDNIGNLVFGGLMVRLSFQW